MTTLRTPPESKLGIKLQNYRSDRPDEWIMDEFTREAEAMNEQNKALKCLLSEAVDYLHSEVDTVIAEDLRNSIAELLEQAK
jgi:hypothetical protein